MTYAKPINESDDWDLLADVAGGDHDAFRQIYNRHNRMVFSFILKRLENAERAEDARQDVFIRLWKKADTKQRKGAKFSTFLLGIANYVVMEHWKALKKYREAVEKVEPSQVVTTPQTETGDVFYQIAVKELSDHKNWRKGQPKPNLAFHLAVFRRRQAGIEAKERTGIGQESDAIKGSSVVRRYLWLRLWASDKGSIS